MKRPARVLTPCVLCHRPWRGPSRYYNKLSGMTGTASASASELFEMYKLRVVKVPTNKPRQRRDQPPQIYLTYEAKMRVMLHQIVR